jgi:homoserine dehydrogenase
MDVRPEDVHHEGITSLSARDFQAARELGYAIKLLAIGRKQGDGVQLRVHPAFVPQDELLASVDGVLNAVEIEGDLMSRVLFQGPGAGSLPTTSAVVADALDAAVSISNHVYWPHSFRREAGLHVIPISEARTRYYLRIRVVDRPGVLAQITRVLGDREISIASMHQPEVDTDGIAEIVMMTHEAREDGMRAALKDIRQLADVTSIEQVLRVKP